VQPQAAGSLVRAVSITSVLIPGDIADMKLLYIARCGIQASPLGPQRSLFCRTVIMRTLPSGRPRRPGILARDIIEAAIFREWSTNPVGGRRKRLRGSPILVCELATRLGPAVDLAHDLLLIDSLEPRAIALDACWYLQRYATRVRSGNAAARGG